MAKKKLEQRHSLTLRIGTPMAIPWMANKGVTLPCSRLLAMALDDPTMDIDLRETLAAHKVEMGEEWADVE